MNKSHAPLNLNEPTRRLRVLVLSEVSPAALFHGTGLRAHHLLRFLEKVHEIELICAQDYPVLHPASTWSGRLRSLFDFKRPFGFRPDLANAIEQKLLAARFDVILLFGAEMLQYLTNDGPPVVADLVDEPFRAALRGLNMAPGISAMRSLKRCLSLVAYERHWCRRTDTCVVVSDVDARSLSHLASGIRVMALPNGVDTSFFRPGMEEARLGEILFFGNMAFPPNVAAAVYFARKIFPLIRAVCPEAHWTVAGSNPHPDVQALTDLPGIEVTGSVPDLRPYIERASVIVSPMISGGGIKNKILEAWAMRKGIVATPSGCAGVDARDGVNLYIARQPRIFAEKTIRLLRCPQEAAAFGRAGQEMVQARYSWEEKAAALSQLLLTIATGKTRSESTRAAGAAD